MTVRLGLLAILDQGPGYGYQLRSEFDRRTGSTWPLNVGQVYSTLDRLDRDGLVERDEPSPRDTSPEADGSPGSDGSPAAEASAAGNGQAAGEHQRLWRITAAGRAEVAHWLGTAVDTPDATRDELPLKFALAATLPGVDVATLVQTQRRASLAKLQRLTRTKHAGGDPEAPGEFAWRLVVDSMIFAAEAEVRWLDHVESSLRRASLAERQWAVEAVAPTTGGPGSPARTPGPARAARGRS
ncbi:PadR family transcriptional regulator [Frigoribacterium sp. 2355]